MYRPLSEIPGTLHECSHVELIKARAIT